MEEIGRTNKEKSQSSDSPSENKILYMGEKSVLIVVQKWGSWRQKGFQSTHPLVQK